MQKLRVGVIMGGKTIEKEVSFNSGRTVCDHLDTSRYDIIPLFQTSAGDLFILPWQFLRRGKISDFEHKLFEAAQHIAWDDLKNLIDFAYIATHGRYAEDGTLQGFLEVLGIAYLGSKVFASALGMDKIFQKEFLHASGIDVPRGIIAHPDEILNDASCTKILERLAHNTLQFPVIVKPYKEGSSLGVSIVHSKEFLHDALLKACTIFPGKTQSVLIEEKIEGMEFTCIAITDYKTGEFIALPPTEIVHDPKKQIHDYEQKYMPGKAQKFTPARQSERLIKKIQDQCLRATKILNFNTISRIDGFLTPDERVVIIDPNSLSGMGPAGYLFRQAAEINMSHTDLINHLIETELHAYGMLETILNNEKKEQSAMNIKKIRVAVLLGGASNEKEISLESGRNIIYKLSPQKYEVLPIFVSSSLELFPLKNSHLVHTSTIEIEQRIDKNAKIRWQDLPTVCDFVFIALHGGHGENGAIQGTLEMLGLPYNGSGVLASALCMDKYKTTTFLHSQGFDVPQSLLIDRDQWMADKEKVIQKITDSLPLPLIIKPHDDGCSVMVQKAKIAHDITPCLNAIFAQGKTYALVEECIIGMELTVGVIGNEHPQALPPSQALSATDILSIEEKFLPGAGENQTPAPLPAQTLNLIQETIVRAYKALGCKGYSRIDCFYQTANQSPAGKERVVILENNTLPGMTSATVIFHQSAELGIKPMDFIDRIITLGFEEHGKRPAIFKEDAQGYPTP